MSVVDDLEAQISEQIAQFEEKRKFQRSRSNRYFYIRIALVAIVTVLSGISSLGKEAAWPRDFALLFSAGLSAITLIEGRFNFKDLHVLYTYISSQLHALRAKLRFQQSMKSEKNEEFTPDEAQEIFAEFQEILNRSDSRWIEVLGKDTVKT
jgi:cystathionine beta-lyase/cystathionine gamma-synthase